MMEIIREDSITFKLTNTAEFPSLHIFCGIMDKIQKESVKKGFKNMFNKDERFFIENFTRELNNEVTNSNK